MPAPAVPLFDTTKLNRQTRGDPSLQVEVLSLFVAEVERLMRQVEDAPDPQVRGDRLRALIGVARNVGATHIAQQARSLETEIAAENPDMTSLKNAISETLTFIQRTKG
jgi:HPt (histidine-containing phosphotransfer) domain-containing protein